MYFSIEFLILSAVCVLIIFGTIINHYKQSSSMWFKKYSELSEKYIMLQEKYSKIKEQNLKDKLNEIKNKEKS